ncbi:MAG: hypothetical protein ACI85F_002994 [Bacteroidia bacterium]|jgi:hypothetical protein
MLISDLSLLVPLKHCMYRFIKYFFVCAFIFLAVSSLAQDKLLLTNGKIRNLRGEVVHTDVNEVRYQRYEERERELDAIKRIDPTFKGHIWDLFKPEKTGATAELRFAEEIKEKMESLSDEDFEAWKKKRYLQLKEREVAGTFGDTRKAQQLMRRYSKRVKSEQVFSVLKSDGSEIIVYAPDTLGFLTIDVEEELDYNVNEMRAYIKGRQDGRKHRLHDIAIGAGMGYIGGLIGTAYGQAFYTPMVPAVALVIMGVTGAKIKPQLLLPWTGTQLFAYQDGYVRSAKGRKMLGFALGSVVGLGVGITVGILERPYIN